MAKKSCSACDHGIAQDSGKTKFRVFDRNTGKYVWVTFGQNTENVLNHYFDKNPELKLTLK